MVVNRGGFAAIQRSNVENLGTPLVGGGVV
jgi:hypothetical protein